MRTARAILARIVMSISLGVATTVLLAWALAAFLPHHHFTYRKNLVGGPRTYITIFEFSRPGMLRRDWQSGFAPATSLWSEFSDVSSLKLGNKTVVQDRSWGDLPADLAHPTRSSAGAEDARGWPWLCLFCSINVPVIEAGAAGSPSRDGYVLTKLVPTTTVGNVRILPLRPIWRGLIADVAVFSAAWGLLIPAVVFIRAYLRRRRGRCCGCGYDLRPAPTGRCPECGRGAPSLAPIPGAET